MAYDLYPAVDENYNFPPEVRGALATSAELKNTVVPMSQTLRNNLTGAELWDGRLILNTTTDRINRYDIDTGLWNVIVESSELSAAVALETELRGGLRNVLRNGDFSVWQRGAGPFTAGGFGIHSADGWKYSNIGTGSAVSVSRQQDNYESNLGGLIRSRHHADITFTGGTSSDAQCVLLHQSVEGIPFESDSEAILSFVANVSTPVTVWVETLIDTSGTMAITLPNVVPIALTPGAKRYSVVIPIPAYSGPGNVATDSFRLAIVGHYGSAITINQRSAMAGNPRPVGVTLSIGEIQLEPGTTATKFERLSQQHQLAWCQRYFQRRTLTLTNEAFAMGMVLSGTAAEFTFHLPVQMRTPPNVARFDGDLGVFDGGAGPAVTSTTIVGSSSMSVTVGAQCGAGGLTTGRCAKLYHRGGGQPTIDFSAEL